MWSIHQIRQAERGRGLTLSLGDVIDPDRQIDLYRDQIAF